MDTNYEWDVINAYRAYLDLPRAPRKAVMKEEPGFQYHYHDNERFPAGLVVEAGDQYMRDNGRDTDWHNFNMAASGSMQHRGAYTLRRPLKSPLVQHFI